MLEQQGGRGDCTIIGHANATSLINAAMANGGMAHGDEVDPVHSTSVGGHVAAGPVPTALAVGESIDASGKEVVRAVTLGYELGGRLIGQSAKVTRLVGTLEVDTSSFTAATGWRPRNTLAEGLAVQLGVAAGQREKERGGSSEGEPGGPT